MDGYWVWCGSVVKDEKLFDENGHPTHLYAATGDGPGDFRNAENTWNLIIPLKTAFKNRNI